MAPLGPLVSPWPHHVWPVRPQAAPPAPRTHPYLFPIIRKPGTGLTIWPDGNAVEVLVGAIMFFGLTWPSGYGAGFGFGLAHYIPTWRRRRR
jgi:hypothetical protein